MSKQNDRPLAYGPDPWGGVPHREPVIIKAQQKDRPDRDIKIKIRDIVSAHTQFKLDVDEATKELVVLIEPLIEEAKQKMFDGGYQKCLEDNESQVEEAKREERERMVKDIHSIEFESNSATDFLNKTLDYLKT